MRFWLDKGVDGFRMDVIPLISKQPGLPDLTAEQLKDPTRTFANGPRRDQYLQEMNREVLAHYDDMTVGEAFGITLAEEPNLVAEDRHELNMVFNFDAVRINRGPDYSERKWTLPQLKALYDEHARVLGTKAWDTVFLANHDNPRLVSTFGDDSPEFRAPSAKLLQTMLLTLRGTPFLYQGDELGMTNYPFTLDEFNDIEIKNGYKAKVLTGQMPESEFLAQARRFGRDNARTPMQWDSSANAGFCSEDANPGLWLIQTTRRSMQPTSLPTPIRFSITPGRWSRSTGTIWLSPMGTTRISTLTTLRCTPTHVPWAKLDSWWF